LVREIIERVSGRIAPGDAIASKENVFGEVGVRDASRRIGLVENLATSVPVDLGTRLFYTIAVAVIQLMLEFEVEVIWFSAL
jgi:hypothetical protein